MIAHVWFTTVLTSMSVLQSQDACARTGIPQEQFNEVIRSQFANLVGAGSTTIGSYAGLELKEGKATLATSSIFASGSVLAVKVVGGATDGLLSMFSGSKLNTEIS